MQDALNEMQRLLTDIGDQPETYVNKPTPKSPDGGSRVGGKRRGAVVDAMTESIDVLKRDSMDEDDGDSDSEAERDSDGLRCRSSSLLET